MSKDVCVLAYSGGLDTSIIIKWLMVNKGVDVVAVVGDVGQEHGDLEDVRKRGLASGAIDCRVVDMRQEYADTILTHAIKANGLYENKYPMLSALSRPVISKYLVEIAHEVGAKFIAHGCTGKGNDQVRFESSVMCLDPEISLFAPVRIWDLKTREEEIAWAKDNGIEIPVSNKKPYSIDDNLWGRAIECGVLEDPWNMPPEDIYTMTVSPLDAPDEPEFCEVEFDQGIPCAINGEKMSFLDCIFKMNEIAGRNGFGRLDIIEDRVVGIKSRECYEVPGSLALIRAHQALEDLCLEARLLREKLSIEQKWSNLVYDGLWFSPLKDAYDVFIDETQKFVSGIVKLRFYKGTCECFGRKSPYALYDYELATYSEGDKFDQGLSKGFIDLHSLSAVTYSNKHKGFYK
ncbi:MAG: argininosuccinate synthase [Eggerthellaceae bacterium]|nr:argininosuccinate synthase [Eggerthellaceae bacterium]